MSRATAIHRETFGIAPGGVWSAPGRVNLIGEHTDYNGGLVLPIALPQRTVAAATVRDDQLVRVHSAQTGDTVSVELSEIGPGRPSGWAAYVGGVLWALRENGFDIYGLDITVDGAVPLGAGLSSSAALECAVGAAASDLFGLGLLDDDAGRAQLAAACMRAENEVAGAPTGGMDQAASLRCREGHALLLDCRSGAVEHAPFDLAAYGLVLLVTDTRASHALGDGQYGSRRAACERAAATLGVASLRDVAVDALDAALGRLGDAELVRRTRPVVT
ncbi:MAG: galactokinase, partial [Phycicoccus sp.]